MSRFEFAGDLATEELPRLEEEARRRREDYRNRIRAIDGRIASWTAKLAQESMDRDMANAAIMDQGAHTPLEKCVERNFALFREDDSEDSHETKDARLLTLKPVHALAGSINKLERELLKLKHRVVFDEQNRHFVSLQRNLTERIAPQLQMECTKADKREGSLVRKFEAISATCERGMLEQRSLNMAELEILESEFDKSTITDQQNRDREQAFLEIVRSFRQLLKMESSERKKQDELIVEKILQTQQHLRTSVLHSIMGDPSSHPPPAM